ncbi:MAG: ribosomal protein S18-alanine N-acetyltransferase [Candidatus Hydrogenedentes bacterium]|nr:ribosomal protein S18-alanine N-acetyltransferase [Candidatus Hydrogenedentota bacterium]
MIKPEEAALEFERLRENHIDALIEVEIEAYPEPWTEAMFRDELRNQRSHFYVAFRDLELVGYGGFWLVLDEAHITNVTIRDVFRGRNYGRRLMTFLLNTAVSAGARLATLEVRVSNLRARNLYLSMGFRPVHVRKRYYPKTNEDAFVMLKELVSAK